MIKLSRSAFINCWEGEGVYLARMVGLALAICEREELTSILSSSFISSPKVIEPPNKLTTAVNTCPKTLSGIRKRNEHVKNFLLKTTF